MIDIDKMLKWLKVNIKTDKITIDYLGGLKYDYVLKFRLPKHIFKTKIYLKSDLYYQFDKIEEVKIEVHTLWNYLILTSKNDKRKICNVAKKLIKKEYGKW